jgi:hypothetical protein
VLNLIILSSYNLSEYINSDGVASTNDRENRRLKGEAWERGVNIASYIFAIFNFLLFLLWAAFKWRIEYKINREKYFVKHPSIGKDDLSGKKKFSLIFIQSFWKSDYVISFALHTIFALLGAFFDPFFHTLHLLLWFNISEAAKYILDATTKRINTLF